MSYDITGKTITGGTINIHGNTTVTFTGKGTVDSKLSLWGGGATFSAPDAVINGDVDFGSYSGSLTGGTFNGCLLYTSWIMDAIQMLRGSEHWGYKTYAVLAPSIAGQFAPAKYGQVVAGLKALGFSGVAEVALGADMVADRESDELAEKGILTSSCCPGFVGYVKKK